MHPVREVTHRYVDPLAQVWLGAARRDHDCDRGVLPPAEVEVPKLSFAGGDQRREEV